MVAGTRMQSLQAHNCLRAMKAKVSRRRDASRCFSINAADDKNTTTCRFKRKNGESKIAVGQADFNSAVCAGCITSDSNVKIEVWQTTAYDHATPLERVVNIPLLGSQILVYPLIFRAFVDDGADAVPTIGRIRKILCEQMKMQAQLQNDEEDEDMLAEILNDTTTIGSTETELDVPENSDSEPEEPEDSEEEMEDVEEASDSDLDEGEGEEEIEHELLDDDDDFEIAPKRKRRRGGHA